VIGAFGLLQCNPGPVTFIRFQSDQGLWRHTGIWDLRN
jgi:hypothetical protein